MKRRIQAALVTLLLMVGIVIVAGTPAYATVYHGCPSGTGCFWYDANGLGPRVTIQVGGTGYNTCHSLLGSAGNSASSMSADYGGGWDLVLWRDFGCTGLRSCVAMTSEFVPSFDVFGCWNDTASSYAIIQWG